MKKNTGKKRGVHMHKKRRSRILGGILAGCMAFTALFPANAYAGGIEGVDAPYKPFREPQCAYPAQGMKATVGTQQSGSYGGNRVLDGNAETLWEGAWNKVEVKDAWIILDLGGTKNVSGIAELPRGNKFQGGDLNGVITGYDVLVSTDGGATYESKAQGVWDESKEWKYVHFETVENATHIKLQATALSQKPSNPKNVTIAELRVLNDSVIKGNTEELRNVLEQAALLKEEDYVAETWEALKTAKEKAEALLAEEMYVQEEVDRALERVQEAMDGLEEAGDVEALRRSLEEAKAVDNTENHYYKNTYYALQKVIREVEYDLLQGVTKEEAEALEEKLQAAVNQLIVRNVEEQNAFDTAPARNAMGRLVGEANQDKLTQIELRAIDKKECDYDYYEYYEKDGKLVIAGTTNASILTGFHHWLKYVAKCDISWKEDQVNLPDQLPMPQEPVYQSTNAQRRFAGNDMTEQYDGNFWNWEDWEREIDLLALNGFNEVLVYVGQESVFYKTFEELGVENMLNEMPRVSFTPSLFLGGSWRFKADHENNSSNIMTSVTPDIMQNRLEIGQKVCARLRELGMEPIMPGCSGYLAYGDIAEIPDGDIVSQGAWASMPRPGWLKSTSEFYPKLASTYYRIQEELFGECKNWKIDLFNEGGTMGGVDAKEVGRIIQAEMLKVHPDATWHIMHWTGPNPDILKGTDTSKVFIHDIKTTSEFDREEKWNGAEYGFSHLNSMGSRTTMGARVKDLSEEYWKRMAKPGTKLDGVGVAPEGGHHEPIVLESLGELAWQDGPTDGEQWFRDYADRRYGLVNGQPDEHARRAWEILGSTVYDKKGNNPVGDILFAMTPSHTGTMASPTGPGSLGFDAARMQEALNELLQVAPVLRETKTYQYDLILVTTQVFTAYSRQMLPKIQEAFANKDIKKYEQLTAQWLDAILVLDEITGTNENYMLGTWIENAKGIASTEEGKKLMEMDAKEINTIWGPRVSGAKGMFLNYANKTWNGYLKDLYYKQWKMFFENNIAALKGETQPHPEVATSNGEVNYDKWYEALWFDFGEGTGEFEGTAYPTEPTGDTYELVKRGLDVIGCKNPAKVANLKAENAEDVTGAVLSWEQADESIIEKYEIYQEGEKIAETSKTSYVVTDLTEETEYVFGVKAVNLAGYVSEMETVAITTVKDERAPEVVSADFTSTSEVSVIFNEKVTKDSAENTANYNMNYGVQVTAARLSEDGKNVKLTLEGVKTEQGAVKGYFLTVHGVVDLSGAANACVNQVVSVKTTDGIILYHRFDQVEENRVSDVISGKTADVIGNVTTVNEGKSGSALHFGGADEYVDFGRQEAVLGDQFTAGMWVKLDTITPGSSQTLMTHGHSGNVAGGIWWLYTNNSKLFFQLYKGNNKITLGTSSAVLNAGQWQYVTLTRSGRELKLYVDGEVVASGSIPSNVDSDTTGIGYTLKVGAEHKTGQNQYDSMMGLNGSMDEVIVYDRALTGNEIASLMTEGIALKPELLLHASRDENGTVKLSWSGVEEEQEIANYRAVYFDENMQEISAKDFGMVTEASISAMTGICYIKIAAQDAEKNILYESNYLCFGEKNSEPEADRGGLNAAIKIAESLTESNYTADSYAVLKAALAEAREAYAAEKLSEEEIQAQIAKLGAAVQGLETPTLSMTEEELQEKIKEAKETKERAEQVIKEAEKLKDEAKQKEENAEKLKDEAKKLKEEAEKAEAAAEISSEEARQKIAEAEQKMEEAEQEEADAKKMKSEAEQAKANAEQAIADANQKIADAQKAISEAEAGKMEAEAGAEKAKAEAEAAKAEVEAAKAEAEQAKKELDQLKASLNPAIKTGDSVTVKGIQYRVTNAEKKEAEAYGVEKKSLSRIAVAASVTIQGVECKVTSVSDGAFAKLKKAGKAVIGKNVVSIGKKAFYRCKNLKRVIIKSQQLKKVGKNAFKGIYRKAVIKVPSAKYRAYTKLLKKKGQSQTVKIKK